MMFVRNVIAKKREEMFKWFKYIFAAEEDSYYEECLRRDAEIRDIRRRIEEQRNQLPPPRSFHVERHEHMEKPQQNMEQTYLKEKRDSELDAIKKNLIRRKL